MEAKAVCELIKQNLPDAVQEYHDETMDPFVVVAPGSVRELAAFLRDHDELKFDMLQLISGVDRTDRFEAVYHLTSLPYGHQIVLKVMLEREDPHVESIVDVYPAAAWHERETYDLLGIRFDGHPDLRRILLPEDWVGHPLRKDYVDPESYHGISHK